MAKYSTGGGGTTGDGGACELCGATTEKLTEASIAGAELAVCRDCAPHDDRGPASQAETEEGGGSDRENRGRRAAQQAAKFADARKGDPDYWLEHGTDYEGDQLPYLISGYGDTVQSARQDAGLTIDEIAEELDVAVEDIEAVEQNRASRAGVGGSVIKALEAKLDVQLVEET